MMASLKIVPHDKLEFKDHHVYYQDELFTGITKDKVETVYYQDGRLHRDDGPAVMRNYGYQEWLQHGNTHRDDGPAVIWRNGSKEWYKKGLRHREDGPAIIHDHGDYIWYFQGHRYNTINEWAEAAGIRDTDEFVMLKLEWG